MQPYEIRRLRDGSIDYNNYIARPISLLTPEMRRLCRQAASPKTLLFAVIAVGVLVFAASRTTYRAERAQCAPASIVTNTIS